MTRPFVLDMMLVILGTTGVKLDESKRMCRCNAPTIIYQLHKDDRGSWAVFEYDLKIKGERAHINYASCNVYACPEAVSSGIFNIAYITFKNINWTQWISPEQRRPVEEKGCNKQMHVANKFYYFSS